ncbi:MAG: DUF3592 domain-containing protein [Chloroflexota bacterium]
MKSKINIHWENFWGGGLLLYAGGFFLVIRATLVIGIALNQYSWPQTTATVTEAGTSESLSQGRTTTSYHFQYEYWVDDQIFQSRRYSAAQLSPGELTGVQAFDIGEQIDIYYNPDDPGQAVVMRQWPSIFVLLGFGLGIFFLAMATGMTFSGDVFALLSYKMKRDDARSLAFGKQYANQPLEKLEHQIPEIMDTMPRPLRKTLRLYIKNNNKALGVSYLGQKTHLPDSVCQQIMNRVEQDQAK